MNQKPKSNFVPRRRFLTRAGLATAAVSALGIRSIPSLKALGYRSPNERLNLAAIGAGGQPYSDLRDAHAGIENVVALADVDWKRGAAGFALWPNARKYKDFREMLDKSGNDIDAVVIGTPDHMHATCALACMQLGKHVYVEKPLTHTPWEARLLTEAAQKYKVATQMGNQGYSHDATRVACEILWSGEIGGVREVHAWTGRPGWPQEMARVPGPTPVPDTLDWDLWLGCAASRPFTAGDDEYRAFIAERKAQGKGVSAHDDYGFYLPENWRGFFDFGSGLIGDWGVHIMGPANWGLQLSPEHLISVECIHKDAGKFMAAHRQPRQDGTARWQRCTQPGDIASIGVVRKLNVEDSSATFSNPAITLVYCRYAQAASNRVRRFARGHYGRRRLSGGAPTGA
jgi:predicted dehydrogenase